MSSQKATFRSRNAMFALLMSWVSSSNTAAAWVMPSCTRTTSSRLFYENPKDSSFLSECDLLRLQEMKSRHECIPILILDALVPGQAIEFGSSQSNFNKLVAHVVQEEKGEIGILGLHPTTGNPLNTGVTISVNADNVKRDAHNSLVISGIGSRRFDVQGEPFLHPDQFYMANVEMTPPDDDQVDLMTAQQVERCKQLKGTVLPDLMAKWKQLRSKDNMNDELVLDESMPMDDDADISFWIASVLNPPFERNSIVGMDIRPAMLACKNEYERIHLGCTALACSIDRMS